MNSGSDYLTRAASSLVKCPACGGRGERMIEGVAGIYSPTKLHLIMKDQARWVPCLSCRKTGEVEASRVCPACGKFIDYCICTEPRKHMEEPVTETLKKTPGVYQKGNQGDAPNQRQAELIRKIAMQGGSSTQKTLKLHPIVARALKNKGYIREAGGIIGPRGGYDVRYTLTDLARQWLENNPEPDSAFRMGGYGYVVEGHVYEPGLLGINGKCFSKAERRAYRFGAAWNLSVGTWTVNMMGVIDTFTRQEVTEIRNVIEKYLRGIKDASVGAWDWSRVRIENGKEEGGDHEQ